MVVCKYQCIRLLNGDGVSDSTGVGLQTEESCRILGYMEVSADDKKLLMHINFKNSQS